jgi:hypothetical protein
MNHSAVLHPWAAKLTLKSHLSTITLANIMAGDTCEPIRCVQSQSIVATLMCGPPLVCQTLRDTLHLGFVDKASMCCIFNFDC